MEGALDRLNVGVSHPDVPSSNAGSSEFDLRSRLDGPVISLDRLTRSLLMVEISMLSYLPEDQAAVAAAQIGLEHVQYLDSDGAQAYIFGTATDRIVACRGTEPNEWNDIKADANAIPDLAETVGRVHRGFKREVDDLWPYLEEVLSGPDERDLWFAGHSLGGAMAQICAGRCELSEILTVPVEVMTFGSPRVGTKRYVMNTDIPHVRWVNNNDIVTRVPPSWMRYRHRGDRMYIDYEGKVHDRFPAQQRAKDQWRGFYQGLKQRKIDHFRDHAVSGYVDAIVGAIAERG